MKELSLRLLKDFSKEPFEISSLDDVTKLRGIIVNLENVSNYVGYYKLTISFKDKSINDEIFLIKSFCDFAIDSTFIKISIKYPHMKTYNYISVENISSIKIKLLEQ